MSTTEIILAGGWIRLWITSGMGWPTASEARRMPTGTWVVYKTTAMGHPVMIERHNLRGARIAAIGGNGRLTGRHTSIDRVVIV